MDSDSSRTSFIVSRPGLSMGLAGGILSAAILFLLHAVDRAHVSNGQLLFLTYLPLLLAGIFAGHLKKRRNGGRLRLQEAVPAIFGAFFLALVINTAAILLLVLVVDPQLTTDLVEMRRQGIVKMISQGEAKPQDLQEFEKSLQKTGPTRMMIVNSMGALLLGTAFGLIFSIVTAAIIKKDKPSLNLMC